MNLERHVSERNRASKERKGTQCSVRPAHLFGPTPVAHLDQSQHGTTPHVFRTLQEAPRGTEQVAGGAFSRTCLTLAILVAESYLGSRHNHFCGRRSVHPSSRSDSPLKSEILHMCLGWPNSLRRSPTPLTCKIQALSCPASSPPPLPSSTALSTRLFVVPVSCTAKPCRNRLLHSSAPSASS